MIDIVLLGGGGHCKSCIDVIELTENYRIIGIVDKKENIGKKVLGYEIFADDDEIQSLSQKKVEFLVTVGHIKNVQTRVKLFNELNQLGAKMSKVISPLSYVSKYALIGEGTIVMHDAIINADAKIGKNCIVNTKALIEHDVCVLDHCHISTGAIINGGTKVDSFSFVGSGSVSKEYTHILENSFIKANNLYLG